MAGLYLAQVNLVAVSSVPEDVAINTFHFEVDGAVIVGDDVSDEQVITGERTLNLDENGIHGDLSDLYETLGVYLSNRISRANSHIKWYNLSQPAPRFPVLDLPMDNFVTDSVDAWPSEVAAVSSFQADRVQGVSQARRRNRVYMGPLASVVNNPNSGRMDTAAVQAFSDAFENLASNSDTQDGWTWVTYSPTTGTSAAVKSGWVDNAFDTQRRRGIAATVRTEWEQSAGNL